MAGTLTKRDEVYTFVRSLLRVTPIESQTSKSLSKDDTTPLYVHKFHTLSPTFKRENPWRENPKDI